MTKKKGKVKRLIWMKVANLTKATITVAQTRNQLHQRNQPFKNWAVRTTMTKMEKKTIMIRKT